MIESLELEGTFQGHPVELPWNCSYLMKMFVSMSRREAESSDIEGFFSGWQRVQLELSSNPALSHKPQGYSSMLYKFLLFFLTVTSRPFSNQDDLSFGGH